MNKEEIIEMIEQIGYEEFYRYYQEKDKYIELLKNELEELKHIMYVIRDDNGLNHLWCKDMILEWSGSDDNE